MRRRPWRVRLLVQSRRAILSTAAAVVVACPDLLRGWGTWALVNLKKVWGFIGNPWDLAAKLELAPAWAAGGLVTFAAAEVALILTFSVWTAWARFERNRLFRREAPSLSSAGFWLFEGLTLVVVAAGLFALRRPDHRWLAAPALFFTALMLWRTFAGPRQVPEPKVALSPKAAAAAP